MKIKKLYVRITIFLLIIAAVGIMSESLISAANMMKIMRQNASEALMSTVEAHMSIMEKYIGKLFAYTDGYNACDTMLDVIENYTDEKTVADALVTTDNFSRIIPNVTSILFTSYEGDCILHNNHEMIGFRNPDELVEMLKIFYYNEEHTPVYSSSALLDPATNSISLCVSKSCYKKNTTPAGYVAITVTSDEMNGIMDSIDMGELQEVSLLGTYDGMVLYDTDKSMIGLTYEEGPIGELMAQIQAVNDAMQSGEEIAEEDMPQMPEPEGIVEYTSPKTGRKMIGSYVIMQEYGWLMFVGADKDTLYKQAVSAQRAIILVGLIVLALICVALAVIINILTKPITEIQESLTKVANFDLGGGESIKKYEQRGDEIGKLSKATTDVIEMITKFIDVLRQCSSSLNIGTDELNDTSKSLTEVTTKSSEIAENVYGSVEQTIASIQLVTEEINKIAGLAKDVNDKVDNSRDHSEQLLKESDEMNRKIETDIARNMETMQQTMESMHEAMEGLKNVEKINELADIIMQITNQTNLLSLNASIEAARAGEAGRGFAVVAGEIGHLADQSKSTAMNIQQIVEGSNQSVENVRVQVGRLIDYIEKDVVESYKSFGAQSKSYDEGVTAIKDSVTEIRAAMKELNASVKEISKEIAIVNGASTENGEGVANIVDMNEQTEAVTRNIEKLAEENRENVRNLDEIVNQF